MDMWQAPKKMLIIYILEILKKYSDKNHRLSQKEIIDILKKDHDMTVDRKAVKRNLLDLSEHKSFNIKFDEEIYYNKKGEEIINCVNWYYENELEDSEVRYLIDSLLFSKYIPQLECKNLINKLKGLKNKYFKYEVVHMYNMPEKIPQSNELFCTLSILSDAITRGLKVSFLYNRYGIDKKQHPRTTEDGSVRKYIVNPYQIAATSGRYYLICNNDEYDNISNYRVDRISNIKLLENNKVKNINLVKGTENGLNLPKHMAEHIYMFAGESANIKFRAEKRIISEIIDWFGVDVIFSNENKEYVDVNVKVNENAMFYWALQYGLSVTILYPQSLVDRLTNATAQIAEKYKVMSCKNK